MEFCREKIKNKIYFLIIFISIYCSHDTLLFGTNANGTFIIARNIILFALVGILVFIGRFRVLNLKDIVVFALFVSLPLLSALYNKESFNNYVYRSLIMICAAAMIWADKKKEFFLDFTSIMYFLSVWSSITCAIANILPSLITVFPTIHNIAGVRFNFLLFSAVSKSEIYGLVRNTCIFREPGVFAVFLTFSFVFEFIMVTKPRTKYIIAYTIAMITTFSTAGYIILGLVYVYLLTLNGTIKHRYSIAIVLAGIMIIVASYTNLLSAEGALFGKFVEGAGNYGSWFSRLSGLTGNIRIAMDNPWFGIGRYGLYDTILATEGRYVVTDNTNTMMINFAAYGLFFGTISFYGLCRFVRINNTKLRSAIFLIILLCLALSNEDMGQNAIYYVIILTGLFPKEGSAVQQIQCDERATLVVETEMKDENSVDSEYYTTRIGA